MAIEWADIEAFYAPTGKPFPEVFEITQDEILKFALAAETEIGVLAALNLGVHLALTCGSEAYRHGKAVFSESGLGLFRSYVGDTSQSPWLLSTAFGRNFAALSRAALSFPLISED